MKQKKSLTQLLQQLNGKVIGEQQEFINNLRIDSRRVEAGDLFAALSGKVADGHQFIDKAIAQGAKAILCQQLPEELVTETTYIVVKDVALALGEIAKEFYDNPSEKIKLVGVTGTNGKTTIATLLYNMFSILGYKTGLISTIEYLIGEESEVASHTTPNVLKLNELLNKMVEAGCEYAFMEVSSHAIDQQRIAGLSFTGGIFTNLSHDHLDYHETFPAYLNVKKKFFDDLPKTAFALTNLDDKRGKVMLQNTNATAYTYSLSHVADFRARILENSLMGLMMRLNGYELHSFLIGEFNASNLLAIYGTANLLGIENSSALLAISQLKPAEGRFDFVKDEKRNVTGIVDYAHTPDALEKILSTVNDIVKKGSKVIAVVGCGGDRDKTKRPIMAKNAIKWSDRVILTSDNPRTEDPEAILKDMKEGVSSEKAHKALVITNRREAIRTACALAQNGDIIVVAGKGHEKYQEINGVKHPFDDKQVLREAFNV